MKVKVTPPYEGAGSFEVDAEKAGKYYWTVKGERLEGAWCEKIPEVVPEPGDICEFSGPTVPKKHKPIKAGILKNIIALTSGGFYYLPEGGGHYETCRVLARKPKGFEEARQAINSLCSDWYSSSCDDARERVLYDKLLSVILGVPYARVE